MHPIRLATATLAVLVISAAALAAGAPAPAPNVPILDSSGVWRVLYSWDAPLIQTDRALQDRRVRGSRAQPPERPDFHFMTVYPPAGWTSSDFDDSSWARRHFFAKYANGESDDRAGGGAASPYLRQLGLRSKFQVTDPARAGPLTLTMRFRGGAIVYLNGKEIARAGLQAGRVADGAPADMLPTEAYLKPDGKPWHWYDDREAIVRDAYPRRVRQIVDLALAKDLLRSGTNVLAVEIHAAPYPQAFQKTEPQWGSCGLIELHLRSRGADGLVPNVLRPRGVQVWNTNVAEQVYDVSWADPTEALRPVSLVAPRGGCASGRVVVSSDRPIRGLVARLSELATADGRKLAAAAGQVRYGKLDRPHASRWGGFTDGAFLQWGDLGGRGAPILRDDALLNSPPGEVPVIARPLRPDLTRARAGDSLPTKLVDGAVQPVWVVVEVPKDAAPGSYFGKLSIALDGHDPIEVPVELKVIDWLLPEPGEWEYCLGMIESPEALALAYGVEPWSDRHWALVARSLEWIGRLGGKVLYIPFGAESQYGNSQSMVLWVKGADGKYTCDFGRAERYLDLALKHMGKPRFVVVGVWDSCSHVSVPKNLKRKFPRVSVLDPATGKIETIDGPKHGTPEAEAFWSPALTKMRDLLAKRGLADRMLLGYCADQQPDPATVAVFHKVLPGVGWQATRHPPRGNDTLPCDGRSVPILYQANVWGGWDNFDPATRRPYGWKYPPDPSYRVWLDRGLFDTCPICQFRTACEQALLADRHGLGQIGADFWPVKAPDGKATETMVGRFPATSEGNLGIYAGQLLYPAPDGPAPTVRYQMMRENIQECEARIFLEKLLTGKPPRLPADLSARCQNVLDERTRWHRLQGFRQSLESCISWPYSGWEGRTASLYQAAAEAAKAVGQR